MADPDQILQLGIEEARNGNREAARNLFELLTRQEPNNAQAWLWLAGVADGTDQRREALQQVLALDPSNDMARKGLQAMGVDTSASVAAPSVMASVPDIEPEPVRPSAPRSADEAFADELDLAFDDTYAAVPRAEALPREVAVGDDAGGDTGRRSAYADSDRPTLRRPSPRVRVANNDDDDDEPARSGPSPLLWGLLAVIGIVIVGFLLLQFLFPSGGGQARPTSQPTVQVTQPAGATEPTAATGATAPTVDPAAPTVDPATAPTVDPAAPTVDPATAPTADPAAATAVPAPEPTAAPSGPAPEAANPAPVAIGTTLQANGWSYTYPNAAYAAILGKQAGGQTAQGTYLHVLAWTANNTGTSGPMPADFFVLKDGQGRVYPALPQVSSALVSRGVNADVGMEDAIPANGVTTSVYLVFDVQPGATNLVLFARGNPAQGFALNIAVP
jgi:hypothetical protein